MLGELIAELRGTRTARRALPDGKVEVSFEDGGTFLGMEASDFGTYWAEVRPDGSLYGEGQGVTMTNEGAMARWTGSGVGKFTGGGAVSYRGFLSYYSDSPQLSRLNTVAAIFEFDVDATGNTHSRIWEWK